MFAVSSGERRAWLATFFFLGALAAVNLVAADASGLSDAMQRLEAPAFAALFFVWWLALFGSARRAVVAALIAFAWWWPLELYVRLYYGAPLSPQFIGMALETGPRELAEFTATFWPQLVAGLALVAAFSMPALLLSRRYPVRWTHRSRWAALVAIPGLALAMWVFFESQEPAWLKPTEDPFRIEPLAFWSDKWRSVYPLTLPLAVRRYTEDAARLAELRREAAGFRFGARATGRPLDAVVLVLGESARVDRWSLYGYGRPTNPRLEQRRNLVFFRDMVSASVATRHSVPAILSRRPLVGPEGAAQRPEPSLVAAFKEAGYRTAWLSTQSMSGFFDTSIAIYAREADQARFLNPVAYTHEGSYDEALVKPLEEFLGAAGPAMAVVHTMGSHFNYAYRYPPQFDRFKPSSKAPRDGPEGPAGRGVETNNAYDNSILYTDHVLDRLIEALARDGKRSLLVYISDHGEDVYDPSCPIGASIRRGRWSYRVPAFVWMSDGLAREKKKELDLLKQRAALPWQSGVVFQTVMDLAGIELPKTGGTAVSSMLARVPASGPRLVTGNNGRLVDFDAAEKKDDCRIAAN
jgi:glucan phosphoethanolaminetransferase (alkaline phosphatase superfamily)